MGVCVMDHLQAWWRWLRGMPRGLALLTISVAFLGVCVLCSSGALLLGFNAGRFLPQSSLASPSATQAGAKMIGNTATLGGTERGFTADYGAPYVSSAKAASYAFPPRGALGGISITFSNATDGAAHVSGI